MSIAIPKLENLHLLKALLFFVAAALLFIVVVLFTLHVIPRQEPPETVTPPVAERDKDQAELPSRGAADRDTGSTAPRPTGPATQTLPLPPTSVPSTALQASRDLAPAPPATAAVASIPEAAARRVAQARAFEEARARQTQRAMAMARSVDRADRETWLARAVPPPRVAMAMPDTGTAPVASQDLTQSPPTTPGASDDDPVVWNYWLTRPSLTTATTAAPPAPGVRPRPETGELDLQTLHHLNLRFSTLDLSTVLGGVAVVSASPALKGTLEAALAESSRKLLELDVLITPSDEQRLRISMNARRFGMTIDLDGIRSMGAPSSAAGTVAVTDAAIQKATIAEFGFDFRILVAGTHQASVTIVDKRTALPVQSMVISLKSGVPWPNSVVVDASPHGYFRPAGAPPADLVLVLDALRGEADGSTYASLTAKLYHRRVGSPASGGDYDVTTWISRGDLAALQTASKGYRETIGNNDNAQALLEKGTEFARMLFNPFDDVEDGQFTQRNAKENSRRAAMARQIIVDIANDPTAKLPPSMVVQIVKDGRKEKRAAAVLPIGAMGIAKQPGQTPIFLGERFALSLSLTDQDYSANRPCPRDWYLALPSRSAQLKDTALIKALDGLKSMAAGWQTHVQLQTLDLSPLRTWLLAPDERSKDLPFVLSYLGHHASNSLSLAKDTAGIGPGGIERNFQGSSIAILNACDTAMDEINVGTLIGSLAERRVAAIVATTSPIGGDLAGDYMVCMSSVLAEHQDDLTIAQVHALTTRCLFAKTGEKPGLFNYSGSALKYLLIGNPFQHICAPNPGGAPVLQPATATPIDHDEDQPT